MKIFLKTMLIVVSLFSCILNAYASNVNFIAIGDSLTKGYYNLGRSYAPYSDHLLEVFGKKIAVTNLGVNCELSSQIRERLQKMEKPRKNTVIAIMAGTNDIGRGLSMQEIVKNLQAMYKQVHDSGSYLVGMTIPQSVVAFGTRYSEKRDTNNWIRQYFSDLEPKFGTLIDVEALIDFKEQGEDWSDRLHFSPLGYQKIGRSIEHVLGPIIQNRPSIEKIFFRKLLPCLHP